MRILLVNDDGVHSPGLRELAAGLAENHQVTVAAPDREQSAVGHGITMRTPLLVQEFDLGPKVQAYGVAGTPADCTRLGLYAFTRGQVDLVISGPNRGTNLSLDILYSGTVSAALEAAMLGYKAIALSAPSEADEKAVTACFLSLLAQLDVGRDIQKVLNVNIPALPPEEMKGVVWTAQGSKARWRDRYERREAPFGGTYYWLDSGSFLEKYDEDTDVGCLEEGYITLTPLTFLLTDPEGFSGKKFTL